MSAAQTEGDTCRQNAATVRDTALSANQSTYESMKSAARNTGNSLRSACEQKFPDQDFGRSSCIFLADQIEGSLLNVAYAAYVAQRGVIYGTYAGLKGYCNGKESRQKTACDNAAKGACPNF